MNSYQPLTYTQQCYILADYFRKIDLNEKQYLTYQQLIQNIERLVGSQWDQNVSLQLYEKIQKNYDGQFSLKEFYQVYIEAEDILKKKCQNCLVAIDDFKQQQKEAQYQLNNKPDTFNEHGIATNSSLTIQIISMQTTTDALNKQWAIQMKVDQHHQQTSVVHGRKPTWNETFNFIIVTGKEKILIELIDYNAISNQKVYAKSNEISLQNKLISQQKIEEYLELYDPISLKPIAVLYCQFHWLYSRFKYLKQLITYFDENIQQLQDDFQEYQEDLNILYQPFPLFQKIQNQIEFKNIYGRKELVVSNLIKSKGIEPSRALITARQSIYIDYQINLLIGEIETIESFKISYYVCNLSLILALFLSIYKTMFLDIIILLGYNQIYQQFLLKLTNLQMIFAGLLFSFTLDIIWFVQIGTNYFFSQDPLEQGYQKFTLLLSFLLTFIKLILVSMVGYVTYEQSSRLKKKDPQI